MPKNTKKFKQDPSAALGSFSKNLLGLKFMQRAKKEVEKAATDADDNYDLTLSDNPKGKQNSNVNASYQFCERLRFGRFSFKGMNTDIEAIMFNNREIKEEPNSSLKRAAPPSDSGSDNEIDDLESDPDATRDDEEEEEDDIFNK